MREVFTEGLQKKLLADTNDAVWDFLAHKAGSVVGGITKGPLLGVDGYGCTVLAAGWG